MSSKPMQGLPPTTATPASDLAKAAEVSGELASETVSPDQALALLVQDPVGFVQKIVESAAQQHLSDLKEQAELQAAVNVLRKQYPEFKRFEPFIFQEVATLLREDPESATKSWAVLLESALAQFQSKLKETVAAEMNQDGASSMPSQSPDNAQAPYMEKAAKRAMNPSPSSFSRAQIAKMSLAEFLKNEAAINEAMQNNRIR